MFVIIELRCLPLLSRILWLVGGIFVIGVIAIVAVVRRGRKGDLGSAPSTET